MGPTDDNPARSAGAAEVAIGHCVGVMPFDPTPEDLRQWAASGEPWPMEDWDLIIAASVGLDDLADLVVSHPDVHLFLSCMYLVAGDAVRVENRASERADLQRFATRAQRGSDPRLATWGDRTERLLADPSTFNYVAWCGGGLASDPIEAH